MNIDEMIEVLQAYKNGKELEWSCNVDNKDWVTLWDTANNGQNVFNFCSFVYRVKPEPRELWLCKNRDKETYHAYPYQPTHNWDQVIKVREVIE